MSITRSRPFRRQSDCRFRTLTQTSEGWEFIPSEDFVGNVNFSFSVTDGEAFTPAQAKLAVTNVNDDLYDDWGWVDTDTTGTPEDSPAGISIDQLRFDRLRRQLGFTRPEHLNLTVTPQTPERSFYDNGGYTFKLAENFNGSVSFSHTVTDRLKAPLMSSHHPCARR